MTAVPPNDNQQNTEQTKVICHYCKKPGHVIRECCERMRKEQEQRNDPPNQNKNLRHPNHFHLVLIVNGQTTLQKSAGAVPTQQRDPSGSNKNITQKIEKTGKNKET